MQHVDLIILHTAFGLKSFYSSIHSAMRELQARGGVRSGSNVSLNSVSTMNEMNSSEAHDFFFQVVQELANLHSQHLNAFAIPCFAPFSRAERSLFAS